MFGAGLDFASGDRNSFAQPKIASRNCGELHLHERVLKVRELAFNSSPKVLNARCKRVCGSRRCKVPAGAAATMPVSDG